MQFQKNLTLQVKFSEILNKRGKKIIYILKVNLFVLLNIKKRLFLNENKALIRCELKRYSIS